MDQEISNNILSCSCSASCRLTEHEQDAFEVPKTFIPHHYACGSHHHAARPDDPHPGHYPIIPPL